MGVFMEIAREEVHVSLQFLEEGEQWPRPQVLEEYVLKSRFEVPGWVVVVVQKAE
jgi:hypothetical protein